MEPVIVLGIDTCTPMGAVGLVRDGSLVAEVSLVVTATHSERLMSSVASALEMAGLCPADLHAVGVAVGPGSFTGIRIGVSAAKGMAYALGIPCVGVSSLQSLAYAHALVSVGSQGRASRQTWVCPMILARRDEVFWALYRCGTEEETRLGDPVAAVDGPDLSTIAEVVRRIGEARCGHATGRSSSGSHGTDIGGSMSPETPVVVAVGDGSIRHREALAAALGEGVEFPHAAVALGRGAAVADLARLKVQAGNAGDAFSVRPVYLRSTEAEMRWRLSRTSAGEMERNRQQEGSGDAVGPAPHGSA